MPAPPPMRNRLEGVGVSIYCYCVGCGARKKISPPNERPSGTAGGVPDGWIGFIAQHWPEGVGALVGTLYLRLCGACLRTAGAAPVPKA